MLPYSNCHLFPYLKRAASSFATLWPKTGAIFLFFFLFVVSDLQENKNYRDK